MKHEAKFSVISPKGCFTDIQIETFEQAAERYGINVQFPLKYDTAGNLILSSGLNLRDAQILRRQVAGYGFPVDVISDESQIEPINNDRDITSNTTLALQPPSLDEIENWEEETNPPLLDPNSVLDTTTGQDGTKDPSEHPTTEHVMSLRDDELLEVCRNENTSDDELRRKVAACMPTNEMKLSDDMKANLFSDLDSDLKGIHRHSTGIYRYRGGASNTGRDTFRRSSNISKPVSPLGRTSSLGTRSVNSPLPRFGSFNPNQERLGNTSQSNLNAPPPRVPAKPAESSQEMPKSSVLMPAPIQAEQPVAEQPVAEPVQAPGTPGHNIPVISDLQNLPQGLSGSESLAIFIRPPHQAEDPDDNDLDDIFDSLPAPKDDKPKSPKPKKSDEVKQNDDKRIDNIIKNLKPTSTPANPEPTSSESKPDNAKPVVDSQNKPDENKSSTHYPKSLPEENTSDIDQKQKRTKIIIAAVFVVVVLAIALAIFL